MKEFLEKLYEIMNLSDLGVTIIVTNDGWSLDVRDYMPIGNPVGDNAYMERSYAEEFEFDEDGKLIDNLSSIIEKIKADRKTLSEMSLYVDPPTYENDSNPDYARRRKDD